MTSPSEIPFEKNDGPSAGQLMLIAVATLAVFFTFIWNVSP
jgi:hypothetical protein